MLLGIAIDGFARSGEQRVGFVNSVVVDLQGDRAGAGEA
jgi:hypothetical protein